MLENILKNLPQDASVLDYGCHGWLVHALAQRIGRADLQHSGADIGDTPEIPQGATFIATESLHAKLADYTDRFDCVVASHVLEHLTHPIETFADWVQICKSGGVMYVETPSDRAAMVHSDADIEGHGFRSFWDDPTHLKPWPPAALYRLAISYGCVPERAAYIGNVCDRLMLPLHWLLMQLTSNQHRYTQAIWRAKKWACYAIIRKPAEMQGRPTYAYITLKDVPRGTLNALKRYRRQL